MTDCFFKSVFGAWVRYLVNHASLLLALGSNVDSNLRSYVELVVVVDHVREVFILVKKITYCQKFSDFLGEYPAGIYKWSTDVFRSILRVIEPGSLKFKKKKIPRKCYCFRKSNTSEIKLYLDTVKLIQLSLRVTVASFYGRISVLPARLFVNHPFCSKPGCSAAGKWKQKWPWANYVTLLTVHSVKSVRLTHKNCI